MIPSKVAVEPERETYTAGPSVSLTDFSCVIVTVTVFDPRVKLIVPLREAVAEGFEDNVTVTVDVPLLPLVLFSVIHVALDFAVQLPLAVTLILRVFPLPLAVAVIESGMVTVIAPVFDVTVCPNASVKES